jgi:ribosomal-protein-alanine N-acetyltransferase
MSLETVRLSLVPYSPEQLLALAERPERFEQVAGLPAAAGLREFVVSDDVPLDYLAALRASGEPDPWRHGFAVVHRECRAVIGNATFKGPPDQTGMVEIGYGIVPAFEGHGYATEVAAALVAFAFDSGLVRVVRAHTRPESRASMRVLAKCGFQRIDEVVDPDDGLVWRWERFRSDGICG